MKHGGGAGLPAVWPAAWLLRRSAPTAHVPAGAGFEARRGAQATPLNSRWSGRAAGEQSTARVSGSARPVSAGPFTDRPDLVAEAASVLPCRCRTPQQSEFATTIQRERYPRLACRTLWTNMWIHAPGCTSTCAAQDADFLGSRAGWQKFFGAPVCRQGRRGRAMAWSLFMARLYAATVDLRATAQKLRRAKEHEKRPESHRESGRGTCTCQKAAGVAAGKRPGVSSTSRGTDRLRAAPLPDTSD